MDDPIDEIDARIKELERRKSKLLRLAALRREVGDMEKSEMAQTSESGIIVSFVTMEVCERFKVTIDRLMMKDRTDKVALPRQVIFYAAREMCDITSTKLGAMFNKDHGTVLHGVNTVKARMETDWKFANTVQQVIVAARHRVETAVAATNEQPT